MDIGSPLIIILHRVHPATHHSPARQPIHVRTRQCSSQSFVLYQFECAHQLLDLSSLDDQAMDHGQVQPAMLHSSLDPRIDDARRTLRPGTLSRLWCLSDQAHCGHDVLVTTGRIRCHLCHDHSLAHHGQSGPARNLGDCPRSTANTQPRPWLLLRRS